MSSLAPQAPWMDSALVLPEGRRHAALMVHGMAEADRSWLLSRLAPAEREALQPLLEELQDLGIPRDPTLAREFPPMRTTPVTIEAPHLDVMDQASRLSPPVVVAVLRDEPHELVRRIVALRSWPWRDAVNTALGFAHEEPRFVDNARTEPSRLDRLMVEVLVDRAAQVALALPVQALQSSGRTSESWWAFARLRERLERLFQTLTLPTRSQRA